MIQTAEVHSALLLQMTYSENQWKPRDSEGTTVWEFSFWMFCDSFCYLFFRTWVAWAGGGVSFRWAFSPSEVQSLLAVAAGIPIPFKCVPRQTSWPWRLRCLSAGMVLASMAARIPWNPLISPQLVAITYSFVWIPWSRYVASVAQCPNDRKQTNLVCPQPVSCIFVCSRHL